jgi:guanylate kinase
MNKPLFLFVGKSASGKTTVADILEQMYGFKQVYSYCTRKPRYDGEVGHVFVTVEEFKDLENMVAYTFYNNNHYGTTSDQLDECSIYVVDVPGVKTLLKKYKTDRPIAIIYFDATVYTRINRMVDRGDSDMSIIARLLQDEKDDWFKQLDSLVWHYNHIIGKNVELYSINANGNPTDVLEMVLFYMNRYTGDE